MKFHVEFSWSNTNTKNLHFTEFFLLGFKILGLTIQTHWTRNHDLLPQPPSAEVTGMGPPLLATLTSSNTRVLENKTYGF